MEVGNRVSDYEIIQVLGAGGMGKVYKVRNVISDRVEAMKVLLPNLASDPDLADRFLREIKVQATLDHPNIAGLHTAMRAGNQLVMLIEYVEGRTIEALVASGPLPVDRAIDYISQVLSALSYAHSHGVIHRDIKPANMMLTPTGVVKLMDFGIAKMSDKRLTQTGRTMGSLYYMSPEQINGAQTLDGRADLYSLGITLYQLVTGRRPFEADSDYSLMAAHLQQTPVAPIEIDPGLPRALNEIILTAIAKDVGRRFQSAEAFRTALESVARSAGGGPSPLISNAGLPAAYPPPPEPARRSHRVLYMVLGSLATLIVLIAGAIQLPKFFGARAVNPAQVTEPAVSTPSLVQPPPTTTPDPVPPPATTVTPDPVPPPTTTVTRPPRSEPDPVRTVPLRPVTPDPKPPRSTASAQRGQGTTAAPGQQTAAPGQQGTPPVQQTAPPVQQTTPPSARGAEMRDLRERMNQLAIRAGAVRRGLDTLTRQNAARGLGVSAELSSAAQRIEYNMDEAENAFKAGDADAAKRNLDLAERQVEFLERRFGI